METSIWAVYMFVLGACFGSFAGATAWRLKTHRGMVRERSMCEHCHHLLGPSDLLPVASWLWLHGRCRYCKKPIGWSTLLIEVGLGVAFVLSFLVWPYGFVMLGYVQFILWLASCVGLAVLFVYDFRHRLLPDTIVWPLACVGLAMLVLRQIQLGTTPAQFFAQLLFGLLPITGLYGALYLVSRGKWIGLGDVKLGIFIGLLLGWQKALLALMLANYLGLFAILPGLLTRKLRVKGAIPFGPFLIIATFIAFLWGDVINNWLVQVLFML